MRALVSGLLDLAFPPRCLACDDAPPWRPPDRLGGVGLCRGCFRGLPDPSARCLACGRRVGPAEDEGQAWAPSAARGRVTEAPGCLRCVGPLAERDPLTWGGGTRARARRALTGVVAPWSYGGVPRELVIALKFQRRLAAAAPLADALTRALRRAAIPGDLVVPVPLSLRRRRSRGYDQAALLARRVARGLGIERAAGALHRRRHTAPQTSLPRAARQRAPAGAFRARRRRVEGRCVLLIDDVLTSGATAKACALALRRAGAAAVVAAVACRAERSRAT